MVVAGRADWREPARAYVRAVVHWWWVVVISVVLGSIVATVLLIAESSFAILWWALLAVLGLAVAQFLAWRDMWIKREALAQRLEPRLVIECGDAPGFSAVEVIRGTGSHVMVGGVPESPPGLPVGAQCRLKTVAVVNPSAATVRNVRVDMVADTAPTSPRAVPWSHILDLAREDVCDIPPGERRYAAIWRRWAWVHEGRLHWMGGTPLDGVLGSPSAMGVEITAWADEGPVVKRRVRLDGLDSQTSFPTCQPDSP